MSVRSGVVAFAFLLLGVLPAHADVGPKPRMYATGIELRPGDMPGVEIEMTSEDVSVTLIAGPEKRHERLVAQATFNMTNLADAVEIEEGFPVGPVANMTEFSVELDGKNVPAELVDIVTGKRADLTRKDEERDDKKHDYWYVWKATYRAKSPCVHVVKYTVSYEHYFYTMVDSGYVLHTGARWKNAIGKAKVTFRVQGLAVDQIYSVSPRKGLKFDGGAFVWTFENIEPTEDDDIKVHYDCEQTWTAALAEAREHAKKGDHVWGYGVRLVELLEAAPLHAQRTEMTEDEHSEYVRAMSSLISHVKKSNDQWLLPGWKGGPDDLLHLIRNACDAVAAHNDDTAAPKVLGDLVEVAERFQRGRLHGDDGPLKFGEWGNHKAEEEKRLDKNLARARELLLGSGSSNPTGPVRWPWNPFEKACVGPWATYRLTDQVRQKIREKPECEPPADERIFVRYEIAAMNSSGVLIRRARATNYGDHGVNEIPLCRRDNPEVLLLLDRVTRLARNVAVSEVSLEERTIEGRKLSCRKIVMTGEDYEGLAQKLTLWLSPEVQPIGLIAAQADWQESRGDYVPVGVGKPERQLPRDPKPDQGVLTLKLAGEGSYDEATWGKTLDALTGNAEGK